jgi:hypothetical protein
VECPFIVGICQQRVALEGRYKDFCGVNFCTLKAAGSEMGNAHVCKVGMGMGEVLENDSLQRNLHSRI